MTDDAEAPLDPAVERLRRRMLRLLVVSIGTMLVAVMAVLGTVVYKAGSRAPALPAGPLALRLPPNGGILDMALDGERALLRVARIGGGETLLMVDLPRAAVTAEIAIEGTADAPAGPAGNGLPSR